MSQRKHEVGVHLVSLNSHTTAIYPTQSAQMKPELMVDFHKVSSFSVHAGVPLAGARPNHLAQPLMAGVPNRHQVLPLVCMREHNLRSLSRINSELIVLL